MGRPQTPLTIDRADQALAYLQRALDRKADLFSAGLKETERSLVTLRRRSLTLRGPDFAAEANDWLDQHLTATGRRTMLTALRQRQAAEKSKGLRHAVRLTAAAHADVARLAEQMGVPAGTVVAVLAQAALTDPAMVALLAPLKA